MSYLENLVLIAATHRWLTTDELSRLYVDVEDAYKKAINNSDIEEVFILQTCHRVEYYFYTTTPSIEKIFSNFLKNIYSEELIRYFKIYRGIELIEHILRVSSGLDSAIVGECDVLGQVEKAYDYALRNRYIRDILKTVIERSIRFGKHVRAVTGISRGIHGFGSLTVQLLERLYGNLDSIKILIVGAGDLGSTIAKELHDKGAREVTILNRTVEKARQLATELNYRYDHLTNEKLLNYLEQVDVAILAISSEKPLITEKTIQKLRKRPLIIDLGVPRLVEKNIEAPVILFEDLIKLVEKYNKEKEQEVRKVEELLKTEIQNIVVEIEKRELKKMIGKYIKFTNEIIKKEIQKAKNRNIIQETDKEKIEMIIRSIISKTIRPIIKTIEDEVQTNPEQIKYVLSKILENAKKEFTETSE